MQNIPQVEPQRTIESRLSIPEPIHVRLRMSAISRGLTIPQRIIELLDDHLPTYTEEPSNVA